MIEELFHAFEVGHPNSNLDELPICGKLKSGVSGITQEGSLLIRVIPALQVDPSHSETSPGLAERRYVSQQMCWHSTCSVLKRGSSPSP
jgi:hypothetical protein